jgi:hypothetical protein
LERWLAVDDGAGLAASEGALFTRHGRRDATACSSETVGDSVGLVKLDISEEHCENGEAERSDGGWKILSTSDADTMLSLFGRRFWPPRKDILPGIPSSAKLFFRGTRTLSVLESRFFVNPVKLSAELERLKEERGTLGAWKSSSRVLACIRAASTGSEMTS